MNKIFIIFLILGIVSCSGLPNGYSRKDDNIIYKLHQIGEKDVKVQLNDYITIDFAYSTESDSVFYTNKRKIQVKSPDYPGAIDECFILISEGDSASFLLNPAEFFSKTLHTEIPSFLKDKNYFKVSVKIVEHQSFEDFENQKKQFLSWIKDFGEYEKTFLNQYLSNNKIDSAPTSSGMYKLTIKQGEGITPIKGDTVVISYSGKFLNGTFFDSKHDYNSAFEFVLGREWQVIKGIEEAIKMMKQGEKAIVILPSNIAFGENGSSSGIVPPYTSVIYELDLIKVAKGDTLKDNKIIIE